MTITNTVGTSSALCSLPCTPREEKRIIEELDAAAITNRKEGDLYYIVSARWWRDWQKFVESDTFPEISSLESDGSSILSCRPGQIDNTELIETENEGANNELIISRHLSEGHDYVLVPEEVWKRLIEWYHGGPSLPRRLTSSQGFLTKNWLVEVHPLSLRLIDARDDSRRRILISHKASIRDLYDHVCSQLKLDLEKICLWDYLANMKHRKLDDHTQKVGDALSMDQQILLEMHSGRGIDATENTLALVALEPSKTSITIAGGPTLSNGSSTASRTDLFSGNDLHSINKTAKNSDDGDFFLCNGTKTDDKGLIGLHNLGNTCFMNSAIQCLVHTPQLVDYFLGNYSREINTDNPLGMHGELAVAFGELLRKLWSSGRTPVAPRAFKSKLAMFAPQFSGYNQHDSQELLAFLLDGLHEDLNRVKCKPYIEAKDSDGCPDEEFAQECWKNHKARNDSIIVDACQGQYKSTLVCPVCNKISVTFDPFMYLSLPLPSSATRTMTVTVIYGDGSAIPMPWPVTVPKNGCCKDLTLALGATCRLESDQMILLAEVYDHLIYRYFENPSELLSSIKDEECIVAYILPKNYKKFQRLEILHHREKVNTDQQNNICHKLIGAPLVVCLPEKPHSKSTYQVAVETALNPLMRRKRLSLQPMKVDKNSEPGPGLDDIHLEDVHTSPIDEDTHAELEKNEVPLFQLALTDEKAMNSKPIVNNSFSYDPIVRILLGWSKDEDGIYDFSYLDNLPEVCKHGFSQKKTRQESMSLFSCLDAFLKEEPLGPDDMWYCPRCKEHRQATKKLDLWKLPDILVIHLKRFSYSRYFKNKLDTFVNFPLHNLDLSKYLGHRSSSAQYSLYELYAVSNHYGGLGGGHYSAYVKLISEDNWYHFDDSHVSRVHEETIGTSAAYVLFYRRV